MKRYGIYILLALLLLSVPVQAADIPQELKEALPNETTRLMDEMDVFSLESWGSGLAAIWDKTMQKAGGVIRERVKGAACVLLVVLLCGLVESFQKGTGAGSLRVIPMVGAVSVTLLTAGSLDSLIGLGSETLTSLSDFSKVLLPVLAAATAAGGAVGSATVQHMATVFFVDLLIQLIHQLLMPMIYLYIGALTADTMLPDNRLGGIAEMLKKVLTWILSITLMLFTIYLSVAHVISGTADSTKIKLTKAMLSGVVPVVGGIISEAAETVLAGAGVLKGTVGLFGLLAVLSICAYPFLQLAVQYLLYKLTAMVSGTIGSGWLGKLINGLGSAFGLVLGMTGACAVLLLISILSSIAAVVS